MRYAISTCSLLSLAACAIPAGAQGLRGRLESGPDGRVTLSFATRPDVCSSPTVLRVGSSTWFGESSWIYSRGNGMGDQTCERQPVRALLTRAGGRVVAVRVGPSAVEAPKGATDLGPVPAGEAAQAFLDLAARMDGRAGREALVAAVLADSAETWRGLLAIAGNPDLSRGLRESATGWLGRELNVLPGPAATELATALSRLTADREAPISIRTRAVGALARADGAGVGVGDLVRLAGNDEPAIAKAAVAGLARSADPEARATIRRIAEDANASEPVRTQAIKALGGRDASPADIGALRALWSHIASERSRNTVLDVLGQTGGGDNARWLTTLVTNDAESSNDRARAVRAAERAGLGSAELGRLYDQVGDRKVREAILESLSRIADRTATRKLESVARDDTDPALRRSALRRLARVGGDEARAVLEELVDRP